MTKQINVGFDGSATSSAAVLWAAAEANARGARLRVSSCFPISVVAGARFGLPVADEGTTILEETEDGLRRMQRLVEDLYPSVEVATSASAGSVGSALLDDIKPDDLVVVGTTNHDGAPGFWLGSTSRHVVRHSPCPVVVVPGPGDSGPTDRIVVGVDGSPTSRQALLWAGDEADRHGAKLLVVHAWAYHYERANTNSSEVRDLTRADAALVLRREVEAARQQFSAVVDGWLVECGPSAALLGGVRHGDLLVLGASGHGAIHSTLFGSTVKTVLDRCFVPTVVVPSRPAA